MKKKYTKRQKEPITYFLSHKIDRILSYLSLVIIPILAICTISEFSFTLMIVSIIVSICLCFCCWWTNSYKIIIYNDKIIIYNLIKRVFEISKIQALSSEMGYILFQYNDKVYRINGFINWFDKLLIDEKNKELLGIICKKVTKVTRINKLTKNTDILVIAEKRIWTIFPMIFYLLFGVFCFIGLLTNWNLIIFIFVFMILLIFFPMVINKIFTPKNILLYDIKDNVLIINKMFKTIQLEISNIDHFLYSLKGNMLSFKLKNRKTIHLCGIKNIYYAANELKKIINWGTSIFY